MISFFLTFGTKNVFGFDQYDDFCIRVNDKTLTGNEIETLEGEVTKSDCCQICIEMAECKTTSYNEFDRSCILKSSFGG